MSAIDLALFAHLVRRPEEEIDLLRAALLLAEPKYPGLDIAHYVEQIDALAEQAGRALAALVDEDVEARVRTVLRVIFEERGFAGNQADYYDPRNSFLNEVLDR